MKRLTVRDVLQPRLVISEAATEVAEETLCPFCESPLLLRAGPGQQMMVSHRTPTCEGFKARIAEVTGKPMEIHSRETVRVTSVPVGKPGDA